MTKNPHKFDNKMFGMYMWLWILVIQM